MMLANDAAELTQKSRDQMAIDDAPIIAQLLEEIQERIVQHCKAGELRCYYKFNYQNITTNSKGNFDVICDLVMKTLQQHHYRITLSTMAPNEILIQWYLKPEPTPISPSTKA